MKKLLSKTQCGYRAYVESLGLIGDDARSYNLAKILKEYILSNSFSDLADINYNRKNLVPLLDELNYTLDKEKEELTEEYLDNFSTIFSALDNKYTVVEKNINTKMTIGNEDVFLKIDLILQDKNNKNYFAVTIHQGKKTYTSKELNTTYSLEWLVRLLLTETLNSKYPGIRPGKLHLKSCNSYRYLSSFLIIPEIDRQQIKSLYTKELNDVANIAVNKNSCKNPEWNQCQNCPFRNLCEFFKTNNEELERITREKVTSKSLKLTAAQESLMNANSGIRCVNAKAGSGKTTTLSNKIVSMIQEGVDPTDILVITFTEKGIQEIKEKIDYWLNEWFITEISSKDFPIYTFNGYGDVVLKENFQRFGYTAEPQLIDSVERTELIKDILDKYPRIEKFNYANPLLKQYRARGAIFQFGEVIDNLKKVATDPVRLSNYLDQLKKDFGNDYSTLSQMIDEYNNYLLKNNLIEYEDQTNALVTICQIGYENLFDKYYKKNIICDEFQDTDDKQLLYIRACAQKDDFHSLTMVGDASQSIFSWRGANPEIILNLENYFKDVERVKMVENFRSTKEVVELANKIDKLNNQNNQSDMVAIKSGKPVELIDSSKGGTAENIINKVKELIANGENLYDIGIIARTKQELQDINIKLQEEKIKCLVSVSEFLVDNPKVRNILNLPSYLLDTTKNLYLAEFLQAKDPEKFDAQTNPGTYIGEESKRIEEELEELKNNSTNYDKDLVDYFFNKIDELDSEDKSLVKFKEILHNKTFNNLEEVQTFLSKLKAYDCDFSVEKDEEAYDAVTLMTPHSAKGREFKIILAALDKFKPSAAEDNRCLFVTVTRAMEELYLFQDVSKKGKEDYYSIIEELLK